LPEGVEEKEEANNAMAEHAREYSKHLRRVAGKFRRKQIICYGVNQIREKPGVMFGPSQYEPAGNALRHYSNMRNTTNSRAVPEFWKHDKKFSQYSLEPSAEGNGEDQYAYKHIKNVKNKNSSPWLDGWMRTWVKDVNGKGRGLDPVFDCSEFLWMLGLLEFGKSKRVKFHKSLDMCLAGKELDWLDFKTLIINEEFAYNGSNYVADKAGKLWSKHNGGKPIKLRAFCQSLLTSGKAKIMYAEQMAKNQVKKPVDLEA
jgi:hypothetical protein